MNDAIIVITAGACRDFRSELSAQTMTNDKDPAALNFVLVPQDQSL
jgi:hypothetical protein